MYAVPAEFTKNIIDQLNNAAFPRGAPKPFEMWIKALRSDYNIVLPAEDCPLVGMFNGMVYHSIRATSFVWGAFKLQRTQKAPRCRKCTRKPRLYLVG